MVSFTKFLDFVMFGTRMTKNSIHFTISIYHHLCPIFHEENNSSKLQFCPFRWADFDTSWVYLFASILRQCALFVKASFCPKKKKIINRHKKRCSSEEGTTLSPTTCSINVWSTKAIYLVPYIEEILECFQDIEVGKLIRSDDWIKRCGY